MSLPIPCAEQAPPAQAGGSAVSTPHVTLTPYRGPDTPDLMPREQEAIDRAKIRHDERRANSKVRFPPEVKDFLDAVAKADGVPTSNLVASWLEAEMVKRGGTWLKKYRAMIEKREREKHKRIVEGARNRES